MDRKGTRVARRDWSRYLALARELGFLEMAAAPNHEIQCKTELRDWVARGYHADMAWFARGLEKRLNLELVMEDAASVWVLTIPYYREPCTLAGFPIARYACGDDYHDVLLEKLEELCSLVRKDYTMASLRPYVDTGPVLERYWAEMAGLGWVGKNGNLISRQAGSTLFLSCIVTNLVVPYGEPHVSFCGSCRACLDACPTTAIVADGVVDSRKCISYQNIEQRGPFQEGADLAGWLFGCDICQEVCPWVTKFGREDVPREFTPRSEYASFNERSLAEMDRETFSRTFRKSPIKRTKMVGLKRNLAQLMKKKR